MGHGRAACNKRRERVVMTDRAELTGGALIARRIFANFRA